MDGELRAGCRLSGRAGVLGAFAVVLARYRMLLAVLSAPVGPSAMTLIVATVPGRRFGSVFWDRNRVVWSSTGA
ncbi:MAG: hypothetical protein ACLP01_13950 [Solirubrobacteraceae bacterium]